MRPARAIAALGLLGAGLGGLGGCKSRHDTPAAGSGAPAAIAVAIDAAIAAPDANLDACRAAAGRAPGLPAAQRAQALIDGCRPCGDWQPILTWSTPQSSGGPSRAAIEAAMLACHAYCDPNAKQRFLNTLDAARGQGTRGPWRWLGEMCKAEVSAVPDTRFMSGTYFALDRIARALGELRAPGDPALLTSIELPLPALSISGIGLELPEAPAAADPGPPAPATAEPGPAALTVDAAQVLLGTLPVARMSATGLVVSGDYPGVPVALARLAAALVPVAGKAPVVLLAPRSLPAARILQVIAAAAGHELRLAVAAPGPGGWAVPVTVPVGLVARGAPATAIDPGATVDDVARALVAAAARDLKTTTLVAGHP